MKYVVLKEASTGFVTVALCAAPITHHDLAERFSRTHAPLSAGFCEFLPLGKVRTFGESTSLNLKPAIGDAMLIEHMARATRKIAEGVAA